MRKMGKKVMGERSKKGSGKRRKTQVTKEEKKRKEGGINTRRERNESHREGGSE